MKKYLIFIIFIMMFIFWYWLIGYLFFRISESDAWKIAHQILQKKYTTVCGWGFEKNLNLTINHPDAKYSFDSRNDKCDIYINIDEYGWVDTGLMAN